MGTIQGWALFFLPEAAQANEKWWGKVLLVGCSHQNFDAIIVATSHYCVFTYLLGLKENENKKGNDVKKPAKPGLQPGPW